MKQSSKSRLHFYALEPRVLLDGAALIDAAQVVEASDCLCFSPEGNLLQSEEIADPTILPAIAPSEPQRNEVVFIDANLPDYQLLVDGVDPNAEVFLVEAGVDGWAYMSEVLSERTDIDAIHVLGHGAEGVAVLGTAVLDSEHLEEYREVLSTIGQALTSEGDILLWGCRVGAEGEGESFINQIASLTGADIAASDDLTGISGDWDLEVNSGDIEEYNLLDIEELESFEHDLGITSTSGPNISYGGGTLYVNFTLDLATAPGFMNSHNNGDSMHLSIGGYTGPQTSSTLYFGGGGSIVDATNRNGNVHVGSTWSFNSIGITMDGTYTIHFQVRSTTQGAIEYLPSGSIALSFNAAPTLSNLTTSETYLENTVNASAQLIDSDVSFADSDGGNLSGGQLTVTGVNATETISISNQDVGTSGNIQLSGSNVQVSNGSSWTTFATLSGGSGSNLTISFNGSSTPTYIDSLIQRLTYQSSSATGENAHNLSLTVTDGDGGSSGGKTISVTVTGENDAPSFSGNGTLSAVDEDTSSPSGATVTSIMNSLFSDDDSDSFAGIAISTDGSNNATEGDWEYSTDGSSWYDISSVTTSGALLLNTSTKLRFVPVAEYNGTPGSLTVFAVDDSSATTFTSGATRQTFDTTADDATSKVAAAGVTIGTSITAANDAPVATAGATLAYSENSSAAAIDATVTLSDVDDTQITGATVTLSSGFTSGDTLGFSTQNGISGSYNSSTGVLTLSGTATVAQYQAALRTVTYSSSSEDPTSGSASRTVSWQVTDANSDGDGAQNSSAVTSTINLTASNDTPVATAGATLAYSENGSAAAIDNTIALSDSDDTQITAATVTLSSGFTNGDTLGFTTQNGISGSYNSSTGVLTLSGSATVAQYQSALRTVTYSSSSEDPTTNGSSSSRTVSWQVTDANSDGAGAENSSSVTSTINITASNDAPTSSNGTVSVTELVSYSLQASDFNFSDVDSGDTLAKIKIVTLPANGSLTLSGNAVTAGDEILIADINAGNLKYTHSDHTTIGNSYTSFTYKVNDSQIDSVSAYTLTINVSADTFISDGTQYLSQSKTVYSLDTSSQPYTFNTIVTADNRLNSIGFNYDDGYIYGTINGTNKIYRIGASGTIVDLGAVSGLPSKTYFRGDFDQQGNYYIIDARKLYIVDVDTMSVTSTQRLSARFGAADGAYNEHDGKLYGASRNKLYSLDPSNGKVEVKWVDNLPSNTWGAAWFDGAGRFFVAGNQTGDIFRIDDFSNPEAVFVSKGQPSGNNDGTASDAAPVFIHTVSTPAANAYLGGTSVTHTYAIDNGKQPSVLSSGFEDTLSDSRTFDTSTLQIVDSDGNTLAGGGVNYTATFSLSDSKLVISGLSVPALKQFTITVDVDLPVMTPEIYYNQAKLTGIESNLSSNGEILSDNPGGIKPDATPMVVASATATNKITGTVFNDLDQDGVKDSNETGIGGVKLTLSNGDISYTDVNGSYTFDFLADGTYSITETQPSGFTSYTADTITGVIVAGGSTQTVDFADFGEGSITGTVYLDQNGNTTQDGTEGGLNSVTVTLKNSSGTTVSTTTTDSEGRYDFSNVTPGAYWVEQTLPSGYTNTSAQNVSINLGASKKVEVNFGDIGTGIITGTVFDDLNGNATQEVAEDGLSGVTLTLTDSSGSSSTTTTDSDGFYQFTALTSGTYSVTETDPSSYSSDTSNTQTAVIVNGGSAGVHFADRKTGSLSGFTFADLNGDGTFDADDVGISGITITLTDRDGDTFSATTANNGSYQFLNVDPGSYTVDSGGKSGYISIAGTQRSGTLASDGSSVSNFAMVPPGLILGTVYNDYDGDGEQGASENGLSGVEITLTDSSNNATYIHTDSDGSFEFSSVAAGTYTVSESDPTGFVSTTNSYSVTLAGGDSANVNFGDRPSGSLSGTVFDDRDGDATQDVGENGLSNVTLTLSNGDTATTDNDGFYLFDNIAIGDYTLVETDPANVISTTNNSVAVTISSNAAASVDYADQIKFAPISVNDAYTLNEGATLTTNASTGVVANDTDKNSDTLTTTLISGVSNGTLTLNSDGSFSYIHDGSETTSDSFSYKINDGTQDSGNATVNLTITPVNDAPVLATNTGMTINEDSAATTLTTSMLNVTDVDNSDAQLTYTVTTSPTKGSLSHSSFTQAQLAAGLINYTPSADQYGADSFTFTVSDGAGGSISATQYAITITNINDAPVVANAIPDQSHSGSGSWSYQVPSNTFSDVDLEDTHSWSAILGDGSALPSWLSFNTTTRTFTGNPPNGVTSVSLKVSVDDGNGGTEDDTFVLTISSANDDPVASDDSGSATEAGGVTNGTTGSSASGNVLTNDSDNDTGDTKAVAAIRSGSTEGSGTAGTLGNALAGNYGSLTINSDGSYSYSIDENNASVEALANGETITDTFNYTVADSQSATDIALLTVTITGSNDAPVITNGPDTASLTETDSALTTSGTLTVGDVDTTDVITSTISGLVVSGTSNRSDSAAPSDAELLAMLTITPTATLNGTETSKTLNWSFDSGSELFDYLATGETLILTYSVTATDDDGTPLTDSETLTLTITGSNDDPVITGGAYSNGITESNSALSDSGSFTIGDVDTSDVITSARTLVVSGTSNRSDSAAPSDAELLAMLTITPTATLNGTETSKTLNWSFDSGSELFDYLATGETLILTYSVTATDDDGTPLTDSETLTLTVTGSNDDPVITGGAYSNGITESNSALSDSGSFTISDVDTSDVISATRTLVVSGTSDRTDSAALADSTLLSMLTVTATPVSGSSNNGTLNWSFDSGAETFDYLATGETLILTYSVTTADDDGTALSDSETVTLTLTGSNDGPTITNGPDLSGLSESDSGLSDSGTLTVGDLDVNNLVVSTFTQSVGGTGDRTLGSAPEDSDLLTMFTITPTATVGNADQSGTLNWSFDSGTEPFNYLKVGETLVLTYTVTATENDAAASSATATVTVTITGTNDLPLITAVSDQAMTEDTSSSLTLAVDDLENESLTYAISGGSNETVTATMVGRQITLTPASNYESMTPIPFTVTVTDASGGSSNITFNVTVANANDAPYSTSTIPKQSAAQGTPYSYTLPNGLFGDIDTGDAAALTHQITLASGDPLPSWLSFDAASGVLSGTPGNDDVTTDALILRVTATDPSAATGELDFVMELININDAPVAIDDIYSVDEANQLNISAGNGLLSNDQDPDAGDSQVVSSVNGQSISVGQTVTLSGGGTLTINQDGSLSLDASSAYNHLADGENATETATYTLADSEGLSDSGTVTFTVVGKNDAPVLEANKTVIVDQYSARKESDANRTGLGIVAPTDLDSDSSTLGVTITHLPTGGTTYNGTTIVTANDTLTTDELLALRFKPTQGFNGDAGQLIYEVSDGSSSATQAISIQIQAVQYLDIVSLDSVHAEGGSSGDSSGTTDYTFTVHRSGYLNGATDVNWQVDFSEAAGDATNSDFLNSTLANGTVTFAADEVSKQVTVSVLADGVVESDEDFTVRLTSSAIDADTIAAGVIQRSLQATADGVIQNDDTAPQISSVSGPVVTGESRLYWSGDELIVEMQFDRIVVTSGTLTLDLTIGTLAGGGSSITDQTRQATLKEGSGTNTLRFAYTIQSEDVDPDGIAVVANSLSGSISDLSGNSADLTLTASDLPNLNNLRINAFDGVVVDGYITGGTVFADADRDQTLDAGEASDTTDNSGNFTILGGEGPLVLSGGTDISTNLAFEGVFEAPPRAEVINPLTTLLVEMAGYSASDASFQSTQAPLRTALGLDASIDLYTYDPIIEASRPNATAGEITIAVTAQKEAAKIANLLVQGSSVLAGAVTSGTLNSGDAGRAIASALASYINARPSQAIDLSDTTVIQTVLNSAAGNLSGIDTARVSSVASLAASVIGASNDKVAAASADAAGLTAIAQSQVVAQGDAADALESGTNSNDLSSAQSSYTGANLDSAVNSASVGTIFPVYLEISESVASQFEGDSAGGTGTNGYGFTVTRSGDTNTAFSVDYTISGEVNSSDFASGSLTGTLSFVSGETSKSLTLDVLADLDRESDESFSVTLSNASVLANLTTEQASGEILNDDPRTPTVTLPTTPSIRVGVPTTISGISVDDGDSNTLSLTLVSTNGTLSLAGPATISGSNTSLTVSGTLDQLNTTLGNLIFEGTTGEVSATITITPDDSDATTFETASTLNINLESAPEHLLPSRPSVVGGHATEILGIAIRDIDDAHRGENITLTLTPDKGTIGLTASGSLTINDLAAGKKQLIGTVGDINATLGSLDFTATRGETSASIQFESTDGSVLTPDDSDLLLMDIVAAPEQTVATADLTVIAGNATSVPGFTVSDLDSANLQATLTPYGGTIAVDSLGSVVISEPSSGVIRLYGLVAEVNSVLNTLTFTGGATDLSARINMVTTDLSVITPAATGNYDFNIIHTPDLALPATPSLVAGSTLEVSGISLTDADTDTHTITLTATGGSIAADAAAGATVTTVSGSVLTISGSTATVNNTLTNLEFTAPSATVASTGTIQMVANDNDSRTGNDSETLSLNILADPDLSLAATQHLVSGVATAVSGISVVGGGSGVVTAQLVVSGGSISLTGNSLGAVAHSGEDRYTITGTADGVNQVLATLTFNGDSGVGSNASIQFSVDLGNILLGNLSGTQAIEVHDAPTLTVPGTTPLATVGVPLGVDGITVNDIDDNSLTMTLTPASGSLSLTAAGAVAATTDSGSGVVTLIGTPADINSSLDTLRYTAVAGSATGTIAVSVDDSDSITSNATSSWSLDLVARPELTLPASAAVAEGVPVSLSGISVADSDSSALTLTLTPTNGILNSVAGDLILTGTASAINASLNALTFTADIGATSATLSGELTDGDSRTANATGAIPLTVVVGQPPLAGGDLTVTAIAEDSTATAVNLSLTPTTLDDPDDDAGGVDQTPQQLRIISVTGGTLTQSDSSVITLGANGTKLTLTGGTIGLRFTPDSDRDTDATVTYVLVDRIIDSLNSTASTVTVPITAAQDAPVITHSATTFTYTDTAADDTFVTQTLAATATDADTGATLSWGIQNPTDSSVVTTLDGTFGTLSVTGSTFSYTPNDTALEGIKSNNTEHFNIQVSDGIDVSTQLLTIEVTAENDPTQFGGDDSGAVTEDQVASASGTLTVSDRDSADGTVVAQSGIAGSYGTFSIDSSGNWSYQLDDSKPTVQSLAGATVPLTTTAATAQLAPQTLGGSGSERVSEAFTVTTSAGENHTINVTIRGDNDIPTASGTLTDDQKLQGEGLSKETAHLFSDIDNNTVFYYYANNLPRGLTIDSSTGVISGAATRAGLYDVVIHAYDGDGGTATADWNILVVAPVMTESPPPEPGGSTGTEGNPGGGENPSIPGLGPKRPGSGGFDPTGETIPGHQNPIPVPSGTGGIPSGPGGPGDIPGGAGELPGGTRGIPSGTGELPVGPGGIPGGTGELPVGPGGIPSGAGELPGRPETPVRGNPPAPGGEGGIPNGIPKGDVPNGLPPVEGLNDGDIDTNELPQDTPSDEEPSEVIATGSEVAEDQTRRDSEIVSDHVKVGSDAREAREIELKRVDRVDVSVNSDGQVKLVQLERKEGEVSAGLMLVEVRKVDFHYEIEIVDFNQERVLQYSATNPDGEPLPIWVRVDAESGFIYANPPAGVEQLDLRLVAQDRDGASRMMEIKLDFSGKDVNQVAAIEMEHRPSFEQQLQQAGAEWSGQMDDALISMLKDAA